MTSCAVGDGSGWNGIIRAAIRQRRRGADHRHDQDFAESVGNDGADQAGIEHHDGTGDPGHAAAHQGKQLAAREPHQIGADQERRFDMTDKDVNRGTEAERPADPDRAPQHPGKGLYDALQDTPIEQQRGKRADHQHQRQRAKGEDKAGPRLGFGKRQLAAAEIAEDKTGPGLGGVLQCLDGAVQHQKRRPRRREPQKHKSQGELEQHADGHDPPRHAGPVLAQHPGEQQDDSDAEAPAHRAIGQYLGGLGHHPLKALCGIANGRIDPRENGLRRNVPCAIGSYTSNFHLELGIGCQPEHHNIRDADY
jgi:hypothetical protein